MFLGFDPQRAYNIADLRLAARRALPRGLFEFVDRGTEDEVVLSRNRAALAAIGLVPQVLVDVSKRSSETELFGKPLSMPVVVAPTGAAGLLWFDGEIAMARAARAAGIPFTLSTASIVSMERVSAEAGGDLWFQLYMWPDRAMSVQLVERAKAAGYATLVVTVDNAAPPNREYNYRNGFSLPMRIGLANAADVAAHPSWFFRVFARYLLRSGVPALENYPQELKMKLTASSGRRVLPRNDTLRWDDLRDLRQMWRGPLLVKGIMHPKDAAAAQACGADGVIVSNHGGRNLDAAISTIEALPDVVDAVGTRCAVLVDSGFTRGSDIVKALALGAKAVMVGRAPLWGVSAAGEAGAARALALLREEILRILGLTGRISPRDLEPSLLRLAFTTAATPPRLSHSTEP